jgi:hypothetical protein
LPQPIFFLKISNQHLFSKYFFTYKTSFFYYEPYQFFYTIRSAIPDFPNKNLILPPQSASYGVASPLDAAAAVAQTAVRGEVGRLALDEVLAGRKMCVFWGGLGGDFGGFGGDFWGF